MTQVESAFDRRKLATLRALQEPEYTDLSPKGSLDPPIVNLVESINRNPAFFTTSSCSGRIAVFQGRNAKLTGISAMDEKQISDLDDSGGAESRPSNIEVNNVSKGGDWLLVQHSTVTEQDVMRGVASIQPSGGTVTFRYFLSCIFRVISQPTTYRIRCYRHEPFILSVECDSLESACQLLQVAQMSGHRESGIICTSEIETCT